MVRVILHEKLNKNTPLYGFEDNKSNLFANITQQSSRNGISVMQLIENPYTESNTYQYDVYNSDPEDIRDQRGGGIVNNAFILLVD